jgi:hypothetical protein
VSPHLFRYHLQHEHPNHSSPWLEWLTRCDASAAVGRPNPPAPRPPAPEAGGAHD